MKMEPLNGEGWSRGIGDTASTPPAYWPEPTKVATRYIVALLVAIALFTPPASAQVSSCDQDCLGILRGAVQWLIDDKDYEKAEIVLNTGDSRVVTPVAGDARNAEIMEWFANQAELDRGAEGVVTDCSNIPARSLCALTRGKVFLTFTLPPRRGGTEGNEASMPIAIRVAASENYWGRLRYILTLARDEQGAWHVTGVEEGPVT